MTIKEYLTNPAGKDSSVLINTEIKNSFDNHYELCKDSVKIMWYSKSTRFLICHVRVPSKTADGLLYDVVLEFDLLTATPDELTINNTDFKCFSNCPSFVYTYAYVFNKLNMMCKWLTSKYDKVTLQKEPKTRNQYKIIGFERSLYIAMKYISSESRNKLSSLRSKALPVSNHVQITSLVSSQRQIDEKYKHIMSKNKPLKDKNKDDDTSDIKIEKKKASNAVKNTMFTKKSSTVSRTKKIRKI